MVLRHRDESPVLGESRPKDLTSTTSPARISVWAGRLTQTGENMANIDRSMRAFPSSPSGNRFLVLWLAATGFIVALFLIGSTATADTEIDIGNGVRVESVRIVAANAGEDTQVQLLIVNQGQTALHLKSVSSAEAEGSRIDTAVTPGKNVDLEILTIPPNETLNLETFHQRLFLARLKRDLVPGQELEIQLHFLEGDLSVVAHVH